MRRPVIWVKIPAARWQRRSLWKSPLSDVHNKAIKRSASTSAPLFFHYAAICITSRVYQRDNSAYRYAKRVTCARTIVNNARPLCILQHHIVFPTGRWKKKKKERTGRCSERAAGLNERINFNTVRTLQAAGSFVCLCAGVKNTPETFAGTRSLFASGLQTKLTRRTSRTVVFARFLLKRNGLIREFKFLFMLYSNFANVYRGKGQLNFQKMGIPIW